MKSKKGKVYLVGAGPGRRDLVTLRGYNLLKQADCVIYDKLANPGLLGFAGENAEVIHTPKRIGSKSVSQKSINELLIKKSNEGKMVVRLKGGDPCIFGRGGEEAEVLARNEIPFEIVPGITAATAAAEYSGMFLTDRNYSSEVIFVTGREDPDKKETGIDWDLLAGFRGTIVFYMSVSEIKNVSDKLIKRGMSPETPASVIQNATFSDQKIYTSNIKEIPELFERENVKPPAIIIIGKSAEQRKHLNWFEKQSLSGQSIIITRDKKGNSIFGEVITERGGTALDFPAITIKTLPSLEDFKRILPEIGNSDWVIFTSANGVGIFFEYLEKLNMDARVFANCKIAAIGEKTAHKLSNFSISTDFVPDRFTSVQMGEQMSEQFDLAGRKMLLIRSDLATEDLENILEQNQAECNTFHLYTVNKIEIDLEKLRSSIEKHRPGFVTFTSPSSADSFFSQVSYELIEESGIKVVSIGPVTTEKLKELKIERVLEAKVHTIEGILDTIEEHNK